MDCPRCKLPLVTDRYEGVPVETCRECWGYWLDRGELARIADAREFVFTEEERCRILAGAAFAGPRSLADPVEDAPVGCPRCGKVMEKVHFNVKVPITLDRCPSHGIWLDTSELKLAQVLSEEVAAVRRLFLQKLKE